MLRRGLRGSTSLLLAFLKLEYIDFILKGSKEWLQWACSDIREHTVVICEVYGPYLLRGGGEPFFQVSLRGGEGIFNLTLRGRRDFLPATCLLGYHCSLPYF